MQALYDLAVGRKTVITPLLRHCSVCHWWVAHSSTFNFLTAFAGGQRRRRSSCGAPLAVRNQVFAQLAHAVEEQLQRRALGVGQLKVPMLFLVRRGVITQKHRICALRFGLSTATNVSQVCSFDAKLSFLCVLSGCFSLLFKTLVIQFVLQKTTRRF